MNLPILPKKVDLDLAITELGLGHMPIIRGIKTLLLYSIDYGLPIYFDDTIEGINSDIELGEIFTGSHEDGSHDFIDFIQATDGEITLVHGAKKIERASAHSTKDTLEIYFSRFSQNEKQYSIPDTSRTQCISLSLAHDKFYINKVDILNFKNNIDNHNRIDASPSSSLENNNSIPPETIALALLAREKAESSPKFKNGNNVNASAFKNHIVKLAEKNTITNHGLNSLDDKICKALKKHDLRELP